MSHHWLDTLPAPRPVSGYGRAYRPQTREETMQTLHVHRGAPTPQGAPQRPQGPWLALVVITCVVLAIWVIPAIMS